MDYFVKKTWIRIAVCAVLVAVVTLAVTGVFSGNQPLTYDPAAKNIPAGAVTVEATEQGFGGDVTVSVSVVDSKVQALSIDTPDETEGLGKRASEAEFTDQFIGKDGLFAFGVDGIEALSGATVTSNAALKAINRAYTVAVTGEEPAAEPEAMDAPAEEPAPETAETTETPAEVKAEEPATEGTKEEKQEASSDGQAYGVYRAVKRNDFSTVTVTASAKNGALTAVKIASEGEDGKDLLTDAIREEWAKAIMESGSAEPDAITGATLKFSAASVTEAMKEILAEMNGEGAEAPAEEEAEEPAEEKAEQPAAEEKKEEKQEAASDGQAYGVYRTVKQNDFSTVTVTASAKNGALTAVKITSEGEDGKDLLTDAIRDEWAKAILESGSAEPDAITGATLKFSAASVTEAMKEILAEMNGEAAEAPTEETSEAPAEEKAAEPAVEKTKETAEEKTEEPAEEKDEEPETVPAEEKPEEPAKTPAAYAGYRAEAVNDFSKVTIIAYAKNGVLKSVKIFSKGEDGKDLLTVAIRDEWARAILESGSAAPDAVTGASLKFSSASVQEAMEAILAMIGGN